MHNSCQEFCAVHNKLGIDESNQMLSIFSVKSGLRLQRKALPPPKQIILLRSPGSTSGPRARSAGEMLGDAAKSGLSR